MVAVNYLWNPLNDSIVREFDDAGAAVAEYTTEPEQFGNIVSQRRDGTDSYLHYDGVGSTLAVTNQAGTVTDTRQYTGFGEVTDQSGAAVVFFQYVGRTGYYSDLITQELSVRHRVLSPYNCRWLSVDPVAAPFRLPPVCEYAYANNNPCGTIDPSGLVVTWIIGPFVFFYGRYCGYSRRGPGIALDCVDAACQQHDIAFGTWTQCFNPATRKVGNAAFCAALALCLAPVIKVPRSCYSEPTPQRVRECLAAAYTIMTQFACPVAYLF